MEYLIANPWIIWLAVGIVFLIVELLTTALVSIWFVPSAIITCLLSFVLENILLQILVFIILSAIFMVICRKIYNKHIKKKTDEVSQNEKLIGKTAIVTEDTNAITGRILVGDIYWKAVTENDDTIPKGEIVVIKNVTGTTLVINKI